MDTPPPQSDKSDETPESDPSYDKNLPDGDKANIRANPDEGKLKLQSLDDAQQDGVDAYFNKKTGDFAVYDPVSGITEYGKFKTNTEGYFWNEEIAPGDYAILQRGGKDGFRLEAYDQQFGDDKVGDKGVFPQSELRLHGPSDDGSSRSRGCVTDPDKQNWERIQGLIKEHAHGEVDVDTKPGVTRYYDQVYTERLPYYGTLHVF
jgi:hypothetical protein